MLIDQNPDEASISRPPLGGWLAALVPGPGPYPHPSSPVPHRVLEPFLTLLPKTPCVELCWSRLFALRATVRWVRLGPDRSVRAPTFDPWAGRGGWGGGLGGVPGGVAHARIGWASSGPALPPRASVFVVAGDPDRLTLVDFLSVGRRLQASTRTGRRCRLSIRESWPGLRTGRLLLAFYPWSTGRPGQVIFDDFLSAGRLAWR